MSTPPVDNFDDLFDFGTSEAASAPIPASVPVLAPEEDPELVRIKQLESQLAQPLPSFKEPEAAPTANQLRIKMLEDQLAKRNADIVTNAPPEYVADSGDGERLVLHFEQDGFMALGQMWYRGQEIEFVLGSPAYERTKDRTGFTWLSLVDDPSGQLARWGKHYFARGLFVHRRGEKFEDDISQQDARRGRSVPVFRN